MKLTTFNWNSTYTNLTATISQVIDGKTWVLTKSINGEAAQSIWNARGESEDQLIARILAA